MVYIIVLLNLLAVGTERFGIVVLAIAASRRQSRNTILSSMRIGYRTEPGSYSEYLALLNLNITER